MNPLFSKNVEPLALDDAVEIKDGDRVLISASVHQHLLEFLGPSLASHISVGHVGRLIRRDYGLMNGGISRERNVGFSLELPFNSVETEARDGLQVNLRKVGKPNVFVTQTFLRHLQFVRVETHEWELVR